MASGATPGAVDALLQRKLDTLGFLQQDNMDLLQDDEDSVSIKDDEDDDESENEDDDESDDDDDDDDDGEDESDNMSEDELSQSDNENEDSELVSIGTPSSSSIEANSTAGHSTDALEACLNDDNVQETMDAEVTAQTTVENIDGVTTSSEPLDTVTEVVNAVSNGIYTESGPEPVSAKDQPKKPARKRKRTTTPKTGRKKDSSKKERKKRDKKRKMNERANIRKIKGSDDLEAETRVAQEEEQERRKRLMGLKQHKPAFAPVLVQGVQNSNTAQAMSAEEKASHLKSLLEAAEEEAEKMAIKEKKIIDLAKDEEKKAPEKKPAVNDADVITLSSDEEEDNDDVVVSEKFDSDEDMEEIEDTNDSGYHVTDEDNTQDEEGRVLVNIEHPSEDPDIFLAPQIARAIKPHQIGGVRFLYDNMVESVSRFRASHGFGCILAHSMGLGKTIQVIAFLDILLRHTNTKTVMVIVPINTLQNWMAEFNRWLPKPEPNKEKPSKSTTSTGAAAASSSSTSASAAATASPAAVSSAPAASSSISSASVASPFTSSSSSVAAAGASLSSMDIQGFPSSLFTNSASQISTTFPAVIPQISSISSSSLSSTINNELPLTQTSAASDMPTCTIATSNSLHMPTLPASSLSEMPHTFTSPNAMDMPSFPASSAFGMHTGQGSTGLGMPLLVNNDFSFGQTSTPSLTTSALPRLQTSVTSGMSMAQTAVASLETPPLLSSSSLSSGYFSSSTIKSDQLSDSKTSSLLSTDEPDSLSASIDAVMAKVLSECASSSWPPSPSTATLMSDASLLSDLGAASQPSSSASFADQPGEMPASGSSDEVVDEGPVLPRSCQVFLLNDSYKTMPARAALISKWYEQGGILLLGYEMYRLLASKNMALNCKTKGRRGGKVQPGKPDFIDLDEEDRKAELIEDMQGALMRPGPDIVVCDEGHRIKNSQAGISQALKNIRTRRRVVLTGYPLQNNLMEYWCMVDFVRPNYLGTRTEFSNMFERPIINGQCADSTSQDMRVMRFRAHVLHSLLEGFVQRRGHTVLQNTLPPKSEYVFLVKMSPVQKDLYRRFMMQLRSDMDDWTVSTNPLRAFAVCCKIWNHPDVMYKVIQRHGLATDDADLDIDGDVKDGTEKKRGPRRKTQSERRQNPESLITYDWAEPLFQNYKAGLLENSSKMVILLDLVQHSIEAGDKILIFSQSLSTLDLIEYFLSKQKVPFSEPDEYWASNKNYFRLDGSTPGLDRERMINRFNKLDYKFWIFLLSTRAGSLGINLIGANRVIVVDASWNPCHDCQAVCRVYRYGQVKPSYVYRLVTDNSIEKKIYDRQITKQGMSDRVVDELNPQSRFCRNDSNLLKYEEIEETSFDLSKCEQEFDDDVMLCMLEKHGHRLAKAPFTHESLLIDKKELRLTRREKRIAKQSYAMEKRMSLSYARPPYGNTVAGSRYYPRPPGVVNPMINRRPFPFNNSWGSYNRPVASVKPMLSTPVPLQPRRPVALADHNPVPHLTRPGVTIHKVTTTTDIMLPGAATPDSRATFKRIPAGQQVLVIKTPVGVYIRTDEGKIFAVRTKAQTQDPDAPSSSSGSDSLLSQLTSTGKTATEASSSAAMPGSQIRPTIVQARMGGSSKAGMSILAKGNQMKSLLASTLSSKSSTVATATTTTASTSTASSVKSLTLSSALPMHDLSSLVDEAMSIDNNTSADLQDTMDEDDEDDDEESPGSSSPAEVSGEVLDPGQGLDVLESSRSNQEWRSSQGDGSKNMSQSKRIVDREHKQASISAKATQLDKPSTSIAASDDAIIREALEKQRPSSIEDLLNADSSDFFESLGLVTDPTLNQFSRSSVPVASSVAGTIAQLSVLPADSLAAESPVTASVASTHSRTSSASCSSTNSTNHSADPLSLPTHSYPYHLPPHPFSHHPHLPTPSYSLPPLGYPPYPLPNYAAYGFPQPMYPTPGSVLGTPMPLPMYSPYADRRLLDSGFLSMGPYSGMAYPSLTSPNSVPLNTNLSCPISPSVSNTSTENSDVMALNPSTESQSSIPLNSNITAGHNNGQFGGQVNPQSMAIPNNFSMHPSISSQNNPLFSSSHMPGMNNDQYNASVGSPSSPHVNPTISSQVGALWNPAMSSSLINKISSENSVNMTEPSIQLQPSVSTSMSHTPPMQQP